MNKPGELSRFSMNEQQQQNRSKLIKFLDFLNFLLKLGSKYLLFLFFLDLQPKSSSRKYKKNIYDLAKIKETGAQTG